MRRAFIALVTLVVLWPTVAMASGWYRCRLDGMTRGPCCRAAVAAERKAPPLAMPELRRTSCCEVEAGPVASVDRQPTTTPPGPAPAVLPAVNVVSELAPPVPAPLRVPVTRAAPASSRAPPLFLAHCAFLI
ncbi:MAG TPA: hypothetical protein VHE35_36760 [Kofleriaceae bacterium]|nr:hypothetical protein [Kofleriaceae bacterium]